MPEKLKEFENNMKTAVEWYRKNCNPNQSIVIDNYGVRLVSDEMFLPIKEKDYGDKIE